MEPGSTALQADSSLSEPPGNPIYIYINIYIYIYTHTRTRMHIYSFPDSYKAVPSTVRYDLVSYSLYVLSIVGCLC